MHATRTRTVTVPSLPAVFDRTPEAASRARRVAGAFLRSRTPDVDAEFAEAVLLVVSELVTNAVRHAGGASCSLGLAVRPDGVAVSVADGSRALPRERAPDLTGGGGGFGWQMVHQLSRTVAVTVDGTGKTICAVVAR
ncbi:ATP-binding protein [Streptomyces sp. H27-D2]|uniref:ATP-binding protein n=1 Tax=Streptomyces sp. H27-D2 TaxID=3046304 RepID=UPI002DB69880|nr:ATP-binding protein [Streptomyces sp. H27-D2]MEC4020569.1 ATP-binding protein [Streptomyces sp. H27-D2]